MSTVNQCTCSRFSESVDLNIHRKLSNVQNFKKCDKHLTFADLKVIPVCCNFDVMFLFVPHECVLLARASGDRSDTPASPQDCMHHCWVVIEAVWLLGLHWFRPACFFSSSRPIKVKLFYFIGKKKLPSTA